jgi:hypothetical protein
MRKCLEVFFVLLCPDVYMYVTFPTCNPWNDVPLCCGFLSCRLGCVPACHSKCPNTVPSLQARKLQCSGMALAGLHMRVCHWACTRGLSHQVPQCIPMPILNELNKYTNSLPVGIRCSVCSERTNPRFPFVLSSP